MIRSVGLFGPAIMGVYVYSCRNFMSKNIYIIFHQVFVSDSRITVYTEVDTWVLVLYNVIPEDQAKYECHFNSDPSQKLAINLNVQG